LKRARSLVYFELKTVNVRNNEKEDKHMANIGLCFVNPAPLTNPENVVKLRQKM